MHLFTNLKISFIPFILDYEHVYHSFFLFLISWQHSSVFLKQSVSKHQHISFAFLCLNYKKTWCQPTVGPPLAQRAVWAASRPCPAIGSSLQIDIGPPSPRWRHDEQKLPANCCWFCNPIHHAEVLNLMPHFIQLFYKQFQSVSPDLSMHLFFINLCFFWLLSNIIQFSWCKLWIDISTYYLQCFI